MRRGRTVGFPCLRKLGPKPMARPLTRPLLSLRANSFAQNSTRPGSQRSMNYKAAEGAASEFVFIEKCRVAVRKSRSSRVSGEAEDKRTTNNPRFQRRNHGHRCHRSLVV